MERRDDRLNDVKTWAGQHPWRAAGRLLWIVLAFAWGGASGAFLAWGPLMAGWPLMVLLGLVGAVLHGGLWLRQQMGAVRGQRGVARRWLGRLLLAHLAIVLAVGAVSGLQLYRIGTFQPLPLDRVAAFDRLTRAMEIAYPYFELKAVDWDALVARYRPQVEAAQSDSAYASAVERMLAELNDAHTGVMPSPVKNGGCFFAATREMEGDAVVVQVGGSAQEVGLTVGSVILTVDGRSLEQALDAVDPRLTYGSTPRQRRARAFQFMLKTPLGGYTRGARGWIGLHPEPKTDVLPLDS